MATFVRIPCELTAWTGDPGHCNWCNKVIPAGGRRTVWCRDLCRTQWERNHIWRRARIFARRRAKYRCTRPGCSAEYRDIEINHIDPRNGAGYGPGCHHHQHPSVDPETGRWRGGLEGLCRKHHREVTNAQASARAAARRAAKNPTEDAPETAEDTPTKSVGND